MRRSLLIALFATSKVLAQTASTEFPSDAAPLASAALQQVLAGKEYSVKPATGFGWRWQFKDDGSFYLMSGSFTDTGKWSVQESKLCTEGRKVTASCNEIRQGGSTLYMKRDSGEIVKLQLQ
jgi:hypothetical protein